MRSPYDQKERVGSILCFCEGLCAINLSKGSTKNRCATLALSLPNAIWLQETFAYNTTLTVCYNNYQLAGFAQKRKVTRTVGGGRAVEYEEKVPNVTKHKHAEYVDCKQS